MPISTIWPLSLHLFTSHLDLLGLFHETLARATAAVLLHDLSSPPAGWAGGLRLEGAKRRPGCLDNYPGAAALPASADLRARLDAAAVASFAGFQVADANLEKYCGIGGGWLVKRRFHRPCSLGPGVHHRPQPSVLAGQN